MSERLFCPTVLPPRSLSPLSPKWATLLSLASPRTSRLRRPRGSIQLNLNRLFNRVFMLVRDTLYIVLKTLLKNEEMSSWNLQRQCFKCLFLKLFT